MKVYGGSAVKGVQRGAIQVNGATSNSYITTDITISPVNPDKSMVFLNGQHNSKLNWNDGQVPCRMEIINATTIRTLIKGTTSLTNSAYINWELVEYV